MLSNETYRKILPLIFEGGNAISLPAIGFKVVDKESEDQALAQIRGRGYADKYRNPAGPVRMIGVEFGRKERNIVTFSVEDA